MAGCHNKLLQRAVSWVVVRGVFMGHLSFLIGTVFIIFSGLLNGYIGLGTWFAALGTWLLAWIGYFGVVTAIKAKQREILSGLKITTVQDDAVVWIKNTSKEWIQFSAWVKDKGLVEGDENEEGQKELDEKWQKKAKNVKDNDFKDIELRYENFIIAPGAKVPIHLKNITKEETYVALAAVKIKIHKKSLDWLGWLVKVEDDERTRVVVYRYAGDMISGREKKVTTFKAIQPHEEAKNLHPHNKWVPVESRKGKR